MGPHIFAVCFVLFSFVAEGSQTTFIQTDHDLVLHVPKSQRNITEFYWKVNQTKRIITFTFNGEKTTLSPTYKDRVEFLAQNLSLILKNVKLSDSGVYTAVEFDGDEEKTLATFDVTVEAPVSAVCLRLDSVSNSSDSCNFTVICQTELFNISRSFTCDTHGCEEPRPQHAGHAHSGSSSLQLYLSDQSIICNHSNHVSWTKDTKDVPQECKKDVEKPQAKNYLRAGAGVGVVFLSVVIVIVFIFMWKRQKQRRVNMENTVYDDPKVLPAPGTRMEEEAHSSVYSLVKPHTAPVQNPTPAPVQNPESLYATVDKPPRTQF